MGLCHRKSAANTLAALKSIHAARPDGAPIYIILDNLSAHRGVKLRQWAARNKVELCFTPTYSSWANPIEAHFGPLRMFTVAGSNRANHPASTKAIHAYLRWRNANARHPDVLAAQRRERAKVRSERRQRWGRPDPKPPDQPWRTFIGPVQKAHTRCQRRSSRYLILVRKGRKPRRS